MEKIRSKSIGKVSKGSRKSSDGYTKATANEIINVVNSNSNRTSRSNHKLNKQEEIEKKLANMSVLDSQKFQIDDEMYDLFMKFER